MASTGHLLKKIKEVGIVNCARGTVIRERYKRLQKKYQFDPWHVSPYELRRYLQAVAEYIRQRNPAVVVDIGCGLGELLRHINAGVKVGYDVCGDALEVARLLSDGDIEYHLGSFDEVTMEQPIDYLVTLGFMHGSREDTWRSCYHDIAARNEIRHFVVDTVPEGWDRAHYLDFSKIMPDNYELTDKMGPFLSGRMIEVYEKN